MGLFPKRASEYLATCGIPRGKNSQVFIVDPQIGSDSNTGLSFDDPLLTLSAALAKCTTNQNDTVILVGGPTALNPAATVTWNKDFTHLVGMSADLPGVGQRARIVGTTTTDLAEVITFIGSGCIVRNIQIYNGSDADADKGAATVSGSRNLFKNVFFAGMGHATPAARAGSYSCKVSGSENVFEDCAFGLDTVVRAAANTELALLSGAARNIWKHCRFLSASETAGKFLVTVADGVDRWNEFEDCIFQNFSENWATSLSNAIDMNANATHQIILRGQGNQLVGVTGWADVVTRIYTAQAAPNAGAGVSTNPTT